MGAAENRVGDFRAGHCRPRRRDGRRGDARRGSGRARRGRVATEIAPEIDEAELTALAPSSPPESAAIEFAPETDVAGEARTPWVAGSPLAGPTLDDVMSRVWEGLGLGLPAACPVCRGEVVPALNVSDAGTGAFLRDDDRIASAAMSASDQIELAHLEEEWMSAMQSRDMDRLEELVADGFRFTAIHLNPEPMTREQWMGAAREGYTDHVVRVREHGHRRLRRHGRGPRTLLAGGELGPEQPLQRVPSSRMCGRATSAGGRSSPATRRSWDRDHVVNAAAPYLE